MDLSRHLKPYGPRWLYLALTLLVAAALVGCGANNQIAVGAQKIVLGTGLAKTQVLHREIQAEPQTLDPSLATDVPSLDVLEDLFEGLTTLDEAGNSIPGVAASWQTSADNLTWTFHLRPDARWSNGAPVTAQDFVYAWRRQVDPATGSEYAQALAPIVNAVAISDGKMPPDQLGVEAPDAHTLIVHLVGPTPYFIDLLANQYLYPIYAPAVKKWGSAWTQPGHMVSNGAFELVQRVINGHITVKRNPYYWNASHVRLSEVVFYPLSDPTAAVSQYLAGGVDFTDMVPASQKAMLTRELGADQVVYAPYFGTAMLSFNLTKPPFQHNPALRLALTMALDRKTLSKYVQRDVVLPAYNIMPPLPGYTPHLPAWATMPAAQRHALARAMYKKAGYSAAHPLNAVLTYPSGGPDARRYMEALAAMWQMNLGAHIQIYNEEWKVFLQAVQLKQPTLFWSAWIGDFPDPFTFMQLYQKGFGMNYGDYDNARFNALVDQATNTENIPRRYALFAQAGAILNQDAAYIPLYSYKSAHLIKPYVKGWKSNIMDRNLSQYMYILAHTEE